MILDKLISQIRFNKFFFWKKIYLSPANIYHIRQHFMFSVFSLKIREWSLSYIIRIRVYVYVYVCDGRWINRWFIGFYSWVRHASDISINFVICTQTIWQCECVTRSRNPPEFREFQRVPGNFREYQEGIRIREARLKIRKRN